jgi:fructan beta-fructosidase
MNGSQPWRPRLHYTAARGWINDPNGLIVADDGEVHLFYQHNPFGDQWGHMSWGHAVSCDFVRWQELPVAIAEDERVSIFSGSVIIDENDSAGFGAGAWVAIYTGCLRRNEGGQAQELAYSINRGRTWTKYAHNPVLDLGLRDFRDPKVFWHAPSSRWVMVVVLPDERCAVFYTSHDLKQWREASRFVAPVAGHGIWECPDLIDLPVRGDAARAWMLKVDVLEGHSSGGSGARLFFGHFDGERFSAERETQPAWADHGADFYAALSWNGLRERAVWVAWMNCHRYAKHLPTSPWRGAMSLPRELHLQRDSDGRLRLCQQPVRELLSLRSDAFDHGAVALQDGATLALLPASAECRAFDLELDGIEADAGASWVLGLRAGDDGECTRVGYDAARGMLGLDRSRAGFAPEGDAAFVAPCAVACPSPRRLRVVVDACSVEVFADDGQAVLTSQILPRDDSRGAWIAARGGAVRIARVRAWTLLSPR